MFWRSTSHRLEVMTNISLHKGHTSKTSCLGCGLNLKNRNGPPWKVYGDNTVILCLLIIGSVEVNRWDYFALYYISFEINGNEDIVTELMKRLVQRVFTALSVQCKTLCSGYLDNYSTEFWIILTFKLWKGLIFDVAMNILFLNFYVLIIYFKDILNYIFSSLGFFPVLLTH